MTKSEIEITLKKEDLLPPMNPDLFDDFVTYLYKAVDLRSFAQSRPEVKLQYFKRFINSLPPKKQGKILFQTNQLPIDLR